MLRIHCVQLFYNLSDPGVEDLLYESEPVRRFVGLKIGYGSLQAPCPTRPPSCRTTVEVQLFQFENGWPINLGVGCTCSTSQRPAGAETAIVFVEPCRGARIARERLAMKAQRLAV